MNRCLPVVLGLILFAALPAAGSQTLFNTNTAIDSSYCGGGAANIETTHFGLILRVDPDDVGEMVSFEGTQNRCISFWHDPVIERRIDNFALSGLHVGASMSHYLTTVQHCVGAVKEYRGHTLLETFRVNLFGVPIAWSGHASLCIIPGECNGAEW